MKLSNTKIQYLGTAGYVDVQDLISCDIAMSDTATRSNWDREGTVINKTFSSIVINFERGSNDVLDDAQVGDAINLKWNDGATIYSGEFEVSQKFNTKKDGYTNTYMAFSLPNDVEIEMSSTGGSGPSGNYVTIDTEQTITGKKNFTGGLTVDSNNVLTSSDAYTKTQSDAAYVAKSSATSGVTAYVRDSGSESNMAVAQVATANSIARRAGNGVLFVGEPTADSHAATKKYVDDNKGTVVSGTNDGTNWTDITIAGTKMNIPSGGSASADVVNFDCEGIYSGEECSGTLSDEDFAKIQKNTTVAKITDASIEEGAYIYSTDRTVVVEDSTTGTEYYVYNFVRPVESDTEVSHITLIISYDKTWQATLYNVKGASEGLTDVDKPIFDGGITAITSYGWYDLDGTTAEDFKAGETIAGELVYNSSEFIDFDEESEQGDITVGGTTYSDVQMVNIGDGFTLAYLPDSSGNIALRLVSDGTKTVEVAAARLSAAKLTREWAITKLGGEYIAVDGSTITSKNNELVVDIQTTLSQVEGYDETVAQTLEHDASGALKWVNK